MSEFRWATTLKICIHIAAVVALLGTVSPVFSADKAVRYLSYTNCGAYTVKDVWLNWKDENGKTKKTKVGSNLVGT